MYISLALDLIAKAKLRLHLVEYRLNCFSCQTFCQRSNLGSHGDWKTWKMKVVMVKSWNMKNKQKVWEFCDQSWNFTNFAPEFDQNYAFFADVKKCSISRKSAFPTFSGKCQI